MAALKQGHSRVRQFRFLVEEFYGWPEAGSLLDMLAFERSLLGVDLSLGYIICFPRRSQLVPGLGNGLSDRAARDFDGATCTIDRHLPIVIIEVIKTGTKPIVDCLAPRGYGTWPWGINLVAIHQDDPIADKVKFKN